MKKILIVVIVVAGMFFLTSKLALSDQGVTEDKIVIGTIMDFSGPTSGWTKGYTDAIEIFTKEINSRGGVHGRKVQVIWEDHANSPEKALIAVKKLIHFDKVFCITAAVCTAPNIVASEYAVNHKIPWLFPINSLERDAKKVNKYIFNFLPLHDPCTRVVIDYAVNTWKTKKFGILYQYDDYGEGEFSHATDQLAKYGLKLVAVENFKRGALDISGQFSRIRAADCDAVLFLSPPNIAVSFLKMAERTGWKPHFLGCMSCCNDATPALAGDAGNGFLCPHWFNPPTANTEGMNRLRDLMKKYYPTKPLEMSQLVGWTPFEALDRALEWTGRDLTVENIIKTCETRFKNYDNGIFGPVTFSPDNHQGGNSVILDVIENGKYKQISGFLTSKK